MATRRALPAPAPAENPVDCRLPLPYCLPMSMHADQLDISTDTAARVIVELLPDLEGESVRPLHTAATTNHLFRVGPDLVARFPMRGADPLPAQTTLEAEHRAMDEFADLCPFPAPRPVAIGPPSREVPKPWTVQTWVPGEVATPDGQAASTGFARDLADLLQALRSADTRGRTFTRAGRGGSLTDHDEWIGLCLERSEGLLPVAELTERWSIWRDLEREQPDVMSHGDLIPANLLSDGTHLIGVLDTGGFSAADPALDLVAAWHLLDEPRRAIVRRQLGCTDLEWERGRAWAFAQAIGLVWYYEDSNPPMAELGRSTLQRLLEDPAQ